MIRLWAGIVALALALLVAHHVRPVWVNAVKIMEVK